MFASGQVTLEQTRKIDIMAGMREARENVSEGVGIVACCRERCSLWWWCNKCTRPSAPAEFEREWGDALS